MSSSSSPSSNPTFEKKSNGSAGGANVGRAPGGTPPASPTLSTSQLNAPSSHSPPSGSKTENFHSRLNQREGVVDSMSSNEVSSTNSRSRVTDRAVVNAGGKGEVALREDGGGERVPLSHLGFSEKHPSSRSGTLNFEREEGNEGILQGSSQGRLESQTENHNSPLALLIPQNRKEHNNVFFSDYSRNIERQPPSTRGTVLSSSSSSIRASSETIADHSDAIAHPVSQRKFTDISFVPYPLQGAVTPFHTALPAHDHVFSRIDSPPISARDPTRQSHRIEFEDDGKLLEGHLTIESQNLKLILEELLSGQIQQRTVVDDLKAQLKAFKEKLSKEMKQHLLLIKSETTMRKSSLGAGGGNEEIGGRKGRLGGGGAVTFKKTIEAFLTLWGVRPEEMIRLTEAQGNPVITPDAYTQYLLGLPSFHAIKKEIMPLLVTQSSSKRESWSSFMDGNSFPRAGMMPFSSGWAGARGGDGDGKAGGSSGRSAVANNGSSQAAGRGGKGRKGKNGAEEVTEPVPSKQPSNPEAEAVEMAQRALDIPRKAPHAITGKDGEENGMNEGEMVVVDAQARKDLNDLGDYVSRIVKELERNNVLGNAGGAKAPRGAGESGNYGPRGNAEPSGGGSTQRGGKGGGDTQASGGRDGGGRRGDGPGSPSYSTSPSGGMGGNNQGGMAVDSVARSDAVAAMERIESLDASVEKRFRDMHKLIAQLMKRDGSGMGGGPVPPLTNPHGGGVAEGNSSFGSSSGAGGGFEERGRSREGENGRVSQGGGSSGASLSTGGAGGGGGKNGKGSGGRDGKGQRKSGAERLGWRGEGKGSGKKGGQKTELEGSEMGPSSDFNNFSLPDGKSTPSKHPSAGQEKSGLLRQGNASTTASAADQRGGRRAGGGGLENSREGSNMEGERGQNHQEGGIRRLPQGGEGKGTGPTGLTSPVQLAFTGRGGAGGMDMHSSVPSASNRFDPEQNFGDAGGNRYSREAGGVMYSQHHRRGGGHSDEEFNSASVEDQVAMLNDRHLKFQEEVRNRFGALEERLRMISRELVYPGGMDRAASGHRAGERKAKKGSVSHLLQEAELQQELERNRRRIGGGRDENDSQDRLAPLRAGSGRSSSGILDAHERSSNGSQLGEGRRLNASGWQSSHPQRVTSTSGRERIRTSPGRPTLTMARKGMEKQLSDDRSRYSGVGEERNRVNYDAYTGDAKDSEADLRWEEINQTISLLKAAERQQERVGGLGAPIQSSLTALFHGIQAASGRNGAREERKPGYPSPPKGRESGGTSGSGFTNRPGSKRGEKTLGISGGGETQKHLRLLHVLEGSPVPGGGSTGGAEATEGTITSFDSLPRPHSSDVETWGCQRPIVPPPYTSSSNSPTARSLIPQRPGAAQTKSAPEGHSTSGGLLSRGKKRVEAIGSKGGEVEGQEVPVPSPSLQQGNNEGAAGESGRAENKKRSTQLTAVSGGAVDRGSGDSVDAHGVSDSAGSKGGNASSFSLSGSHLQVPWTMNSRGAVAGSGIGVGTDVGVGVGGLAGILGSDPQALKEKFLKSGASFLPISDIVTAIGHPVGRDTILKSPARGRGGKGAAGGSGGTEGEGGGEQEEFGVEGKEWRDGGGGRREGEQDEIGLEGGGNRYRGESGRGKITSLDRLRPVLTSGSTLSSITSAAAAAAGGSFAGGGGGVVPGPEEVFLANLLSLSHSNQHSAASGALASLATAEGQHLLQGAKGGRHPLVDFIPVMSSQLRYPSGRAFGVPLVQRKFAATASPPPLPPPQGGSSGDITRFQLSDSQVNKNDATLRPGDFTSESASSSEKRGIGQWASSPSDRGRKGDPSQVPVAAGQPSSVEKEASRGKISAPLLGTTSASGQPSVRKQISTEDGGREKGRGDGNHHDNNGDLTGGVKPSSPLGKSPEEQLRARNKELHDELREQNECVVADCAWCANSSKFSSLV